MSSLGLCSSGSPFVPPATKLPPLDSATVPAGTGGPSQSLRPSASDPQLQLRGTRTHTSVQSPTRQNRYQAWFAPATAHTHTTTPMQADDTQMADRPAPPAQSQSQGSARILPASPHQARAHRPMGVAPLSPLSAARPATVAHPLGPFARALQAVDPALRNKTAAGSGEMNLAQAAAHSGAAKPTPTPARQAANSGGAESASPLLPLPPRWAYNQIYAPPGVLDVHRTKIWSPMNVEMLQSVKAWCAQQKGGDEAEGTAAAAAAEEEDTEVWIRRSGIATIFPPADATTMAALHKQPDPAVQVAPVGGKRSNKARDPFSRDAPDPDRDTTEEETTVGSLETLQREIQGNYRTAQGVADSFVVYMPERTDAMRKESDASFRADLQSAINMQKKAVEFVSSLENPTESDKLDPSFQAWLSLSTLLRAGQEPTVAVTQTLGPVNVVLFLAWFASETHRHSMEARTAAVKALLRLLLSPVEGAAAAPAPTVLPPSLPGAFGTGTGSAPAVSTPAIPVFAAWPPAPSAAPSFATPSFLEALDTVAKKSAVPELPGSILYHMEYARRSGGEAARDKTIKERVERVRRLHATLVIGSMSVPEVSAVKGLLLQFALGRADESFLAALQPLILFLADWDQLRAGWLTYVLCFAHLVTQCVDPLHHAPSLVRSAHALLVGFLRHHSFLRSHNRELLEDTHFTLLQHIIPYALGQRLMVAGERVEDLADLLARDVTYGFLQGLARWRYLGAIRLLAEAKERNSYEHLVTHFATLQDHLFKPATELGKQTMRPPRELVALMLPLVLRSIEHLLSPAGQAQIAQLAEQSARPDRAVDQWGRLPPAQSHEDVEHAQVKPPLQVMQGLTAQAQQLIKEWRDEQQCMRRAEESRRKREEEARIHAEKIAAAGMAPPSKPDAKPTAEALLQEQLRQAHREKLAAASKVALECLDVLRPASAKLWSLLRTRFMSTRASAEWLKAGGGLFAASESEEEALVKFNGQYGFATKARKELWTLMPAFTMLPCCSVDDNNTDGQDEENKKEEAGGSGSNEQNCKAHLAAAAAAASSSVSSSAPPAVASESAEPFCVFLARLAVLAGILEGVPSGRAVYDGSAALGVRFVDPVDPLTFDPDHPRRTVSEAQVLAIENVIAFTRSCAKQMPLAAALEAAALKRAMESDSAVLRLLVLQHQNALHSTVFAPSTNPNSQRSAWYKPEQFLLNAEARTEAEATELRSTLTAQGMPTVLSDLICAYQCPRPSRLTWMWSVLPFLVDCLESPKAGLERKVALKLLHALPFVMEADTQQQQQHSSSAALSLPTLLLRPYFERFLRIAEREAAAEQQREEHTATPSAFASSPEQANGRRKKGGSSASSDSSPIMSLLLARLNLSFPPSSPSHLPSDFLAPWMPRLSALVLGRPNAAVLEQLLSSPLFRKSIFTDPFLLDRLDALVLTPALEAARVANASVVEKSTSGAGRRLHATNEDDMEEGEWNALIADGIPSARIGGAVDLFIQQIEELTRPVGRHEGTHVGQIKLADLPSLASELLARCSAAASARTRCFFLWLHTHERRIYYLDDPHSGENYNSYSMRDGIRDLLGHVHSKLDSDDEGSRDPLPTDVRTWPTTLREDMRNCVAIYAGYEDERPRESIAKLLAGLAMHPSLCRQMVWPMLPDALDALLQSERHKDEAFPSALNTLVSAYWYALEDCGERRKLPLDVGLRLHESLPAIRAFLLSPFHPQKGMETGSQSLSKLDQLVRKPVQSPPQQALMAQALVLFRHVASSGILLALPSDDASCSSSSAASSAAADSAFDQVAAFVLAWSWVAIVPERIRHADTHKEADGAGKKKQARDEDFEPRLSDHCTALRASLLEWLADWFIDTRQQPRIQALLADPIARKWLADLDAARKELPMHPPPTRWSLLLGSLPELPAQIKDDAPATAQKPDQAVATAQNVKPVAESAPAETKAAVPVIPAPLVPSADLLSSLRPLLHSESSRLEHQFREAWDLDRMELDDSLRHEHAYLAPMLALFEKDEFVLPVATAAPLARLITAMAGMLQCASVGDLALVSTLCRCLITSLHFADELDTKRQRNDAEAVQASKQTGNNKQATNKPATETGEPKVVYTLSPRHPPLPLSDLTASAAAVFQALLQFSSIDALPVSVANLLAQSFGALFVSQQLHPAAAEWMERLCATVPAGAMGAGQASWFECAPPWPAYQDALSANPAPELASAAGSSFNSSVAAAASDWLVPSPVTRFRMLAYCWHRHFGRVDGELIDQYQSMPALAAILTYFTSFLHPAAATGAIAHETRFVTRLFDRLNAHCLQWHKALIDQPAIKKAYGGVVEAFKAFARSLPVVRAARWSQLPAEATDAEVSAAMQTALSSRELVWSAVDDTLCDSFFTALLWSPLSIDYASNHGVQYPLSRIFMPLYAAYLQRLAVRFKHTIEHEAAHTFDKEYRPLTAAAAHPGGLAWHLHVHPLLIKETSQEPTPHSTAEMKDVEEEEEEEEEADEEEQDDEEEQEEDEEEEPEEEEKGEADEGPARKRATGQAPAHAKCKLCDRSLVGLHYACAPCKYAVCLDCGAPCSLSSLLYTSTRVMFLQLTTMWRWMASAGFMLTSAQLNASRTGGYADVRTRHAFHWIRPIVPLMEPFLFLTRRDKYARDFLAVESNSAAYCALPLQSSVSVGLATDPSHAIVFDAHPTAAAAACTQCARPVQAAGAYWCAICDKHTCCACAQWRADARHSDARSVEQRKLPASSACLSASSCLLLSSVVPAFPVSKLPRDLPDGGLFFGGPLIVLTDYCSLLNEDGISGPMYEQMLRELAAQWSDSTPAVHGPQLPVWQRLWARHQMMHSLRQFSQSFPAPLESAMARVIAASLHCESLLVRHMAMALLAPQGYWKQISALKVLCLSKPHATEFGAGLMRCVLTSPSSNTAMAQEAAAMLEEVSVAPPALLDALVHVCTATVLSPQLLSYLAVSLPPLFAVLVDRPETSGLVFAFARRVLPQICADPSSAQQARVSFANAVGWRVAPKGQQPDEQRQRLLQIVHTHSEAACTSFATYAAEVRQLPELHSADAALSEADYQLAAKMLADESFLGQLDDLTSWLAETALQSFESVFAQESIDTLGTPTLGFLTDRPMYAEIATVTGWAVRVMPVLPFLSNDSPHPRLSQSAASSALPRVLFELLNWSCTVPLLHSVFLAPNLEIVLERLILHHLPACNEFEAYLNKQTTHNAKRTQHTRAISPELSRLISKMHATPLVSPTGQALTDIASRVLLRLLALGETRRMALAVLLRSPTPLLTALLHVLEPVLDFFSSLLPSCESASSSAVRVPAPFSLRPARLAGFVQQLAPSMSAASAEELKPFTETACPCAPSWEWLETLPTLAAVLIQIAQLDTRNMARDEAAQLAAFGRRVRCLWPVWCSVLSSACSGHVSTSLLATVPQLTRTLPSDLHGQPKEVAEAAQRWRNDTERHDTQAHATDSTARHSDARMDDDAAGSSGVLAASSESLSGCFARVVLLPCVAAIDWADVRTRAPLPKRPVAPSLGLAADAASDTASGFVGSQSQLLQAVRHLATARE